MNPSLSRQEPATEDPRYTVALERSLGPRPYPRHVLRFCGDWISQHPTRREALTARETAIAERRAAL